MNIKHFLRTAFINIFSISMVMAGFYSYRFGKYNDINNFVDITVLFAEFVVFFILFTAFIYLLGLGISKVFDRLFDFLEKTHSFCIFLVLFSYSFILLGRINLYAIAFDNYPFIETVGQMMLLFTGLLVFDILLSGAVGLIGIYIGRIVEKNIKYKISLVAVCVMIALVFNLGAVFQVESSGTRDGGEVEVRSGYPVILIGVDGADWRVINRYKEHFPAFRKLLENGSRGSLKTILPTLSPILWSSIFTGKNPDKHEIKGLYYYYLPFLNKPLTTPYVLEATFITRKLSEYGIIDRIPVNSSLRDAETLYEIFNRQNKEVVTAGVWPSWPLDSTFKGTGVAFKTPERIYTRVTSRLNRDIEYSETKKYMKKNDFVSLKKDNYISSFENVWEAVKNNIKNIETSDDLFYFVFKNQLDRLKIFNFLYLRETDEAQHKHYSDLRPELFWNKSSGEKKNRVLEAYKEADRRVGKLWKTYGKEAIIIVISDHGQGPVFNRPAYEGYHDYAPPGIFLIAGDPIKEKTEINNIHIYDIAPTVLYLAGFPVAKDMDGKVIKKCIKEKYLNNHPLRYINSYELPEEKSKNLPKEPTKTDTVLEEKLKNLGYL